MMLHRAGGLTAISLFILASAALAATVLVTSLGDDGWTSGDTRSASHLDIHGDTQLVLGRNPTEDALIADRIAFTAAPGNPPSGNGALRLTTFAVEDKATLDRDWNVPFDGTLFLEYVSLRESGAPSVAHPAIKIGVDTVEANPTGNLAVDRGEDRFDKILVYEPYLNHVTIDNLWIRESVVPSVGLYWLVNLTPVSKLPPGGNGDLRTLEQWSNDFSAAGLGGATAKSLQVGIGSGNPGLVAYVDYVSSTDGGATSTRWEFDTAGTPVPSLTGWFGVILSVLLALLGLVVLMRSRSASA